MKMMKRLAAGGVLSTILTVPTLAGSFYYEATRTQEGPGKNDLATVRVRAWVEGPRMRVEFVDGRKSGFPEGSFLLTVDGGQTIFFVNPRKKGFAKWELDSVIQDIADLLNKDGGLYRLELSDVTGDAILEEPGEPILGQPTTHLRWSGGYTLKYAMLGLKRVRRQETVRDVWVSDVIGEMGLDSLFRPRNLDTGHEELDRALAAQMRPVDGFTLKSVSTTTTRDKKGREQITRTTTEVTLLRPEPVAAERFSFPDDYRERPLKKIR
jgi:hypothetical protein